MYAVLGDHDFFSNRELVIESLWKNGVKVLDNRAEVVPVGSTYIALTGVTNTYRTNSRRGGPETLMRLATLEKDRTRGPLNVLLTHQPSAWLVDYARERRYYLFLAGHTHGGQVALRLPGVLLAGSSFETPYVTGFHKVGSMLVSVTNGLGLTLAPIRYNAPAEVTLLILKNGSEEGIQIGASKS
jgi:predicted MPP superfamily phosphohydrolase